MLDSTISEINKLFELYDIYKYENCSRQFKNQILNKKRKIPINYFIDFVSICNNSSYLYQIHELKKMYYFEYEEYKFLGI